MHVHVKFGVPLYGATLVGQVVIPAEGDKHGCSPYQRQLHGKLPDLPVILLVTRGDCYFIEKVQAFTLGPQLAGICDCLQLTSRCDGAISTAV